MKKFTTIKTGYSAGVYGCSNEYFNTIVLDGDKEYSFRHKGLYGSDDRVNNVLKDAGYKEFYTPSSYGQVKAKDYAKFTLSEYEVIKEIKETLKIV